MNTYKIMILIVFSMLLFGCKQSVNENNSVLSVQSEYEANVTRNLFRAYDELSEVKTQLSLFEKNSEKIGLEYKMYVTCMIFHKFNDIAEDELYWQEKLNSAKMSYNDATFYRVEKQKKNIQDLLNRLSNDERSTCDAIDEDLRFYNDEVIGSFPIPGAQKNQ